MRNDSWVCFDCHIAVRRDRQHNGTTPCPNCKRECYCLGYRIRIPPRRAAKAWKNLHGSIFTQRNQHEERLHKARIRYRHWLESRINHIQSKPANPGRNALVRELEKQLTLMHTKSRYNTRTPTTK